MTQQQAEWLVHSGLTNGHYYVIHSRSKSWIGMYTALAWEPVTPMLSPGPPETSLFWGYWWTPRIPIQCQREGSV